MPGNWLDLTVLVALTIMRGYDSYHNRKQHKTATDIEAKLTDILERLTDDSQAKG